MRTFWTVLRTNYLRTIPRIAGLTVFTIITLASMVLAVYMTKVQQVKGHVALITNNSQETLPRSSAKLELSVFSEKPPYSALIQQKYDAYVKMDADGEYEIETLRNEEFKNMILMLLKNPDIQISDNENERGAGVNMIGFMMMFLLMLSFTNLFAFADDKEQGQLRRIAAAPASFSGYLAAHCVYCLSMMLPEYILLIILKLCGFDIGFTLWQYAGLLAVLGFLGISAALLLHTLIHKPDNANMLGSAVTVLTSVLAGSFYSFSRNNTVFDQFIKLLPQKQLMEFARYMQNHDGWKHGLSIGYVIAFSTVMFGCSCMILRRMYIKRI